MTVTNIDNDLDGYVSSDGTTNTTTSTVLAVSGSWSGVLWRTFLKFPLTDITAGSTVNDSSLQFNVTGENIEAGEGANIHAYNDTGDDDPTGDSAANRYARSGAGSALSTVDCSSTGSKTADLGATADGQIQGNISSPAFYSLGLSHLLQDANENFDMEATENAGTDPATLIVDWTAPAAGTAVKDMIGGYIPFAR